MFKFILAEIYSIIMRGKNHYLPDSPELADAFKKQFW